jgi:2-polyprenyl-6-methoxyphenol hydroxylase-like FAD-dependent oxidoreductase
MEAETSNHHQKQQQQFDGEVVDVLVVGGGPVGLMTACELRLQGLRVMVCERRETRTPQSRALTIHGRSLEVLALRGVAQRFTALGRPIPVGHYGALDTRLDFSVFDSTFPYTLFLPQTTTEALLEEWAIELGVIIHRGQCVMEVEQDAHSVRVAYGNQRTSSVNVVKCKFVVGADGARSAVRHAAGIDFEGQPTTMTAMLGDVVLAAPPASPVLSACNSAGCMLLAPLGDGIHHRIVIIDHQRTDVPQSEAVTLDELAASTRRVSGQDFGLHDPIWLSRFGNETRLAATYRRGAFFLPAMQRTFTCLQAGRA